MYALLCLFGNFVGLSDMLTMLDYVTLSLASATLLPLLLPGPSFPARLRSCYNLMEFPNPRFQPHLAPSSSTADPLITFPFLPASLTQFLKYFKSKCP